MGATAVYCRISKDREGRSEGVTVQQKRGRAYSAEHWPGQPVVVYTDNDLTAADPTVHRPAYQQLLQAVRAGAVARIVCAEQSRLVRDPSDWEHLAIVLGRAGIDRFYCYRTGPVTVAAGSKLAGRILAAVDAEEVERLKARVNDRLGALATEGRPHGGTPYAYRRTLGPDGAKQLEPDPERAAVVAECVERLLAGWSLTAIAADLAARAVPTATGGAWWPSTVRSVLTNPTVAGLRTHHGRVLPGTWPAVIDADTWRQVQHVLSSPVSVTTPKGVYRASRARPPTRRRYLLTGGVAVCGLCRAALSAQQRHHRNGTRVPTYMCRGCGKISLVAEPFEAHVADRLCAELDRPGFWDAYSSDGGERDALLGRLAAAKERLADLARRFASGGLEPVEWEAAREVLMGERGALEGALAALPGAVERVDPVLLRAGWGRMELGERRRYVEWFVSSVTVAPARSGVRAFDEGRVKIKFR